MELSRAWVIVGAIVAALVVVGAGLYVLHPFRTGPGGTGNTYGGQVIPYTSSVDQTPLSYYEWLPTGYDPNATYPLAVFLHGLAQAGNELLTNSGGPGIIQAAQADGFLLISINTRTNDGFYVNSPYSGPQQQDVVDAVHHEESLRHVGKLYVFGTSMGSVGSLSLGLNHVLPVAGIGAINSCTDAYEAIEWRIQIGLTPELAEIQSVTGGYLPGQSTFATGLAYYMSPARFFPQNFSGIPFYIVQGGNDNRCPNNPNFTAWQNANDTVLTSTCTFVPSLAEPPNCTTPLTNLSAANPALYHWRFVYVPRGPHNLNIMNGPDMFAYFSGRVGDGLVWASPGGTPYPPP